MWCALPPLPRQRLPKRTALFRVQVLFDAETGPTGLRLRSHQDTVFVEGPYRPRIYVTQGVHLPELRRGYAQQLALLQQKVLRQDYAKDRRGTPTRPAADAPVTDYEDKRQDPGPGGALFWSVNRVRKVTLLITPRQDSLLNVEVQRQYFPAPRSTYTDSVYCVQLRRGRVRVVSDRLRPVDGPSTGSTLQQRLFERAARDSRLALRGKAVLRRPCPHSQQLIDQVQFAARGLRVRYVCLEESNQEHSIVMRLPSDPFSEPGIAQRGQYGNTLSR